MRNLSYDNRLQKKKIYLTRRLYIHESPPSSKTKLKREFPKELREAGLSPRHVDAETLDLYEKMKGTEVEKEVRRMRTCLLQLEQTGCYYLY